jgi:hypothetical protein
MSKPVKRVDVSQLTPEQRTALGQFIRDAKTVAPQVEQMKQAAETIYANWLRSPTWNVVEADPPDGERPAESWDIGAPQINRLPDNYFERLEET